MSPPLPFDAFSVALEGRNVVDASAGTGKTYAITTLVVRLLVERRLRVRDVLVVTFTEAATAELRDRVRRRLREAWQAFCLVELGEKAPDSDLGAYAMQHAARAKLTRQWLELALEEVDEAPISTIHGFCHRILQEAAMEAGLPFEAEITADARPLRDEAVFDFHSRDLAGRPVEEARAIVEGTALDQWRALADKVFRAPDARFLPEAEEDREAAWRSALEALRFCWRRQDIEALLLQHTGFKVGLQKRTLTRWCDQIDELIAVGSLPAKPSLGIEGLCPAALEERAAGPNWPRHPAFDVLGRIRELIRSAEAGATAVVAARRRFVDFLRAELPKLKEAKGTLTFDDLLLRLRSALQGPNGRHLAQLVRRQFQAALIDEFQDTDPVQFTIFDTLFASSSAPLFLIGDPKQAIYGFRGADVNAYLEAVRVPGTRHHSMGTNWRSDPRLVEAVNALFMPREEVPHPFLLEGIRFAPVSARPGASEAFEMVGPLGRRAPLDVMLLPEAVGFSEETVAKLVAADIVRLLTSGACLHGRPVRPADVAVLARTNGQASQVQEALRALQVPAVLLGDKSVLDTPDAQQLSTVLAAIVEPTNAAALRQALATPLMGLSAASLVQLEEDAALWSEWAERFRTWHELWIERGFVQMFRRWLEHETVEPRLLGHVDGERRITNLLHLMELIHRAAREQHLGPAGVLHWLGQAPRNSEGGVAPDEAQIRLESDEAAVKLTTVHRSKGLEYPVVYCPFVCKDLLLIRHDKTLVKFHDEEGHVGVDLGSTRFASHLERSTREAMAENLRLLYVALTRAKHRCTIVWGYHGGFKESALASLLFPLSRRELRADSPFGSLGKLSDDQLREAIRTWSGRCAGAVQVRDADVGAASPYVAPRSSGVWRGRRTVERKVTDWLRTTSFSALTAHAARGTGGNEGITEVGQRDRDERAPTTEGSLGRGVPLAGFPRGAKAGNFFHGLLEALPFSAHPSELVAPVKAQLELFRYPLEPWQEVVPEALHEVLQTPLEGEGESFRLAQIDPSQRQAELEFALPLAMAMPGEGQAGLPPALQAELSRIFHLETASEGERRYAARVAQLDVGALRGFVKGFIDLVFEWNGRFYLADYKTNHLGGTFNDYRPLQLEAAMVQGHYFLQSHLYTLALHRHLARTVRAYDYDEHFGGVFYLFLRGMRRDGREGVFFHRPPVGRVRALEGLFSGRGRS